MGSIAGRPSSASDAAANYYSTRRAYHAGSWYEDDADELNSTLQGFLNDAVASKQQDDNDSSSTSSPSVRALIVPHAGYSYSGPTAAYAYSALQRELSSTSSRTTPIRHILVLHPSHHVYLKNGCAVSGARKLQTPVGTFPVDDELRSQVLSALTTYSCNVSIMSQDEDEQEHSGEMQYPYLAKVLQDTNNTSIPVLPVMCGSLSTKAEQAIGQALAPIVARRDVLTVVSSDFCHWGRRFSYQPQPQRGDSIKIHEFIEQMDRRGMDLIQMQRPGAFAEYLKETSNTICGRHAIAVWMRAVEAAEAGKNDLSVKFVRYEQSSAVTALHESSVSYAAAVATTTS